MTDRDAFWLMKHPELAPVEDVEEDAEDTVDYDAHGIHIPGQSWYPFVMAAALFVGGYAVIYHNWFLGAICGLIIVAGTFGWALEGVGGYHIHPEPRSADAAGD